MTAWSNVGTVEACNQAEATLQNLVQRAKDDKPKNAEVVVSTDNDVLLINTQPTTLLFNSVIQCWAASKSINAGEKSEALLKQMKRLAGSSSSASSSRTDEHTQDGDDDQDISSTSSSSSSSTCYFDTHPDIITYNTIISAWSHCGKKDAAPRAEKIVKDLIAEEQEKKTIRDNGTTNLAPVIMVNTITFNTVLHAWSQSPLPGRTDRAEQLLEYMLIQSTNPDNEFDINPDAYSFNCVMDAWAKSKEPNKAAKTRALLDRLIGMHGETKHTTASAALKPTQISYNTVLNACAFSALKTTIEEQREAIKIAVDTYKAMNSPASKRIGIVFRDEVTYGLMLKSIVNLMPKESPARTRMALQIFHECCANGLVGYLVWNEIRRAVPYDTLQEIIQTVNGLSSYRSKIKIDTLEVKGLPQKWTRNCKQGRRRRSDKQRQDDRNGKFNKDKKSQSSKRQQQPVNTEFIVERSFATGKDM